MAMISSQAGCWRALPAASPPSASTHWRWVFTPSSTRSVESGTSVHSRQLHQACVCCGVGAGFPLVVSGARGPEHSRNKLRENRMEPFNFSILTQEAFHQAVTQKSCLSGSIIGTPEWLAVQSGKAGRRDDAVRLSSGVSVEPCPTRAGPGNLSAAAFSNASVSPYGSSARRVRGLRLP